MMPFAATWMSLEIFILSEVSQTEKDKYYVISLIYGIFKIIQMNLYTKPKYTHRHRKQTWLPKGKGRRRGINQKYEINRYTTLYIK